MKVTFTDCGLRGVSASTVAMLAAYYRVSPADIVERAVRIIGADDLKRATTGPSIRTQINANAQAEFSISQDAKLKLAALANDWRMGPLSVLEAAIAQLHDIATGDTYKAHFVQDWVRTAN